MSGAAAGAGTCRSCGADVIWVANVNGNAQPFDRTPDSEKGTFVIVAAKPSLFGIALSNLNEKARAAAKNNGVMLYVPHHATCPDRRRWRRQSSGTE